MQTLESLKKISDLVSKIIEPIPNNSLSSFDIYFLLWKHPKKGTRIRGLKAKIFKTYFKYVPENLQYEESDLKITEFDSTKVYELPKSQLALNTNIHE